MSGRRKHSNKYIRNRKLLLERAPDCCPVCGDEFYFDYSLMDKSPEVDHIVPLSRGGTDDYDNLRVICRECNQAAGNKRTPRRVIFFEGDTDKW